jgi:hypothetical protein
MIGTSNTLKVEQDQSRVKQIQRRTIRLLLQHDHDTQLLRQQFRTFYTHSKLPEIPLLQQYDRYIKLQLLSNELLDSILPNIRRRLSMKTEHLRLREETPTQIVCATHSSATSSDKILNLPMSNPNTLRFIYRWGENIRTHPILSHVESSPGR